MHLREKNVLDTRIFLVFFGLVGVCIKTYFILRYARYALKSDYLILIFELCLRFFILQAT